MYRLINCWVFIIIVCSFFVGSLSFAQVPKSRPPGWNMGEKRGWGSDVPPGLEKKRQEHKEKWDSMTDEEKKAKIEASRENWKEIRQEHKEKWDSMTDEKRKAKIEASKENWKEKRQERKDKRGSLTDEEKSAALKEKWAGMTGKDKATAAKEEIKRTEQQSRMAEYKAVLDRKRAEWATKRKAGVVE